jgi:hypothetical protein
MKRRSVLFAAALVVISLAGSGAQAGRVVVLTDSGNIGGFTITNTGINNGVATLLYTGTPNPSSFMNNVNGAVVSPEVTEISPGPITFTVKATSPGNYAVSLVPPIYTQSVGGTVGSQALLGFDLTSGGTFGTTFFNVIGNITSVMANNDPTYDFSSFTAGGSQNITLTATSFAGGASSFATLFSMVGGSASGSGSFSQIAVPEPASFALLGIGMSGLVALRRIFRKRRAGA